MRTTAFSAFLLLVTAGVAGAQTAYSTDRARATCAAQRQLNDATDLAIAKGREQMQVPVRNGNVAMPTHEAMVATAMTMDAQRASEMIGRHCW